jgi:hypothetical protein
MSLLVTGARLFQARELAYRLYTLVLTETSDKKYACHYLIPKNDK